MSNESSTQNHESTTNFNLQLCDRLTEHLYNDTAIPSQSDMR